MERKLLPGVNLLIVGSEVTNGYVRDSHTEYFATRLQEEGMFLKEARIIPDDEDLIEKNIRELGGERMLIMTGGLGPTEDDKTVDLVSGMLNVSPIMERRAEKRIRKVFSGKKESFMERAMRQGRIPEGALPIINSVGLAPGFFVENLSLVCVPGFPMEVKSMWKQIQSILRERVPHTAPPLIIPVWGVGESTLFSSMKVPPGVEVGVHALPFGCRLFLRSEDEAEATLKQFANELKKKYASLVIENPVECLLESLKNSQQTICFAESCTGGLAAKLVTDIAGASECFNGSIVSYSNSMKEEFLGVPKELIQEHGAVSAPVAQKMAEGARVRSGSDYAISFTGIAGPGGGSAEKPVGTLFTSLSSKEGTWTGHFFYPLGRERFRAAAVYTGFIGALSILLNAHPESKSNHIARTYAREEANT